MLRVLLFGLTGIGNQALEGLEKAGCEIVGVITRVEKAPFPYYNEQYLGEIAEKKGLQVFYDPDFETLKKELLNVTLDLALIASFHKIVPKFILEVPTRGVINLHPSLLPKYRGATPTFWVLQHGELQTGVTAHWVKDENIDSGNILLQKVIKIQSNDTDGVLRYKLAKLTGKMIPELICKLDKALLGDRPQDPVEATYFPKRSNKKIELNLRESSLWALHNQLRSRIPFPGVFINFEGKKYVVDSSYIEIWNNQILSWDLKIKEYFEHNKYKAESSGAYLEISLGKGNLK